MKVLDYGCGFGPISIQLSRYAGEVYALDATWESLKFVSNRIKANGITNIIPLYWRYGACLPFSDGVFDLVCLNGVLEWLGASIPSLPPRDAQQLVLREIRRVLRPEGFLYIGIENRVGMKYLLGAVDDHSSIRWTTVLPRGAASLVTRLCRGRQYRTYTYSLRGYRRLLKDSGFRESRFFMPIPNYRKPDDIIPLSGANCYSYFLEHRRKNLRHISGTPKLILHWMIDGINYAKFPSLSNSFGIISRPSPGTEHYLETVLRERGPDWFPDVTPDTLWRFYSHSTKAWGKYGKVIFRGFAGKGKRPRVVCKIIRDPRFVSTLHKAYDILTFIAHSGSSLREKVPAPLYCGLCGDYEVLIEQAKEGWPWPARSLRCYYSPSGLRQIIDICLPYVLEINGLETRQAETKDKQKWLRDLEDAWSLLVEKNGSLDRIERDNLTILRRGYEQLVGDYIPGVLNHNDFVTSNLLSCRTGIIITDWELSERMDLPMMDLLRLIHRFFTVGGNLSGPSLVEEMHSSDGIFAGEINRAFSIYAERICLKRHMIPCLIALYWLRQARYEQEALNYVLECDSLPLTPSDYREIMTKNRFLAMLIYFLRNWERFSRIWIHPVR